MEGAEPVAQHVLAPEPPRDYLFLEADAVTKNIRLDEEPLKRFIKKLMVYLRDSSASMVASMRMTIGQELTEARLQMRTRIDERAKELEARVLNDPRIMQLQSEVASLQRGVGDLGDKHSRMATVLGRVEEEVIKQSSADVHDMADVRRIVQEFRVESEESKQLIAESVSRLDGDMQSLGQRLHDAEDGLQKQGSRLAQSAGRLAEAEEALSRLHDDLGESSEMIDKLSETKADQSALKDLAEELRSIGELAERGAGAADLSNRVSSLERTRRTFDGLISKSREGIQALQQGQVELGQKFEGCANGLHDVGQRAQAALAERYGELAGSQGFLGHRLAEAEALLSEFSHKLRAWDMKADVSQISDLRARLAGLSQTHKDKEEAVLFGARCLSCNRVFDDVRRDPDVVDLSLERQKGAVFAEIQRALQGSKCDPAEPLSLLAIKVGRPTSMRQKGGVPFSGRDGACTTRGLEDMHLTPLRPGAAAKAGVGAPGLPAHTPRMARTLAALSSSGDSMPPATPQTPSLAPGSRPGTTQSCPRRPAGAAARGLTSPSGITPQALLRQEKLKDSALEFQTLGELLGRGGSDAASAWDRSGSRHSR